MNWESFYRFLECTHWPRYPLISIKKDRGFGSRNFRFFVMFKQTTVFLANNRNTFWAFFHLFIQPFFSKIQWEFRRNCLDSSWNHHKLTLVKRLVLFLETLRLLTFQYQKLWQNLMILRIIFSCVSNLCLSVYAILNLGRH